MQVSQEAAEKFEKFQLAGLPPELVAQAERDYAKRKIDQRLEQQHAKAKQKRKRERQNKKAGRR